MADSVRFPLHLRIPHWADESKIQVNGTRQKVPAFPSSYAIVDRQWQPGDTVAITFPMKVRMRTWAKNQNAVSVDYGPLTFSLKIDERWEKYGNKNADWPEWEVYPASPWNYGLDITSENLAKSVKVLKHEGAIAPNPFTPRNSPIELRAPARRIPNWQMDALNMVGRLQRSPVKSNEPLETVSLIPMGAARLRITSFPLIGHGTDAHEWAAE